MNIWTLEPLYQSWRINKVLPSIPEGGLLVDIGCDTPPRLINQVKHNMKRCVGIDVVTKNISFENVEIRQMKIDKKIDLPTKSADCITMLAVLEHLKNPQEVISECFRILKPGGILLTTTPSPACRPLAEFLALIGLLRTEMIEQHENYFTPPQLTTLAKNAGFKNIQVNLFELGLNTFLKAVK
jgi:2-polyprenyl-3-methyl-5-hydroxy-6-metoxy-1,4-benzoquinol methylase